MGKRKDSPDTAINPNAPVHPSEGPAVRGDLVPEGDEQERRGRRDITTEMDQALDDLLAMGEADAQRDVPRARTDDLNENKTRTMPDQATVRSPLSSRRKKDYSSSKQDWLQHQPKTRRGTVSQVADRAHLETVNRSVALVEGRRSLLPTGLHTQVGRLDRAISDYERHNEREHLVYCHALAPEDDAESRAQFQEHLESMAGSDRTLDFDRYIPTDHNLGNLTEHQDDLVFEIKTSRGAYLGSSDTRPNAEHLLPRGMSFRVLGLQQVTYLDPVTREEGHRTVVQIEDVPRGDERTEARR